MAVRLYFLPVEHLTAPAYEIPKYVPHRHRAATTGLEGLVWAWVTYLLEDVGLLAADVTPAQHTILNGQSDVIAVPVNLDTTLSAGAVTVAQTQLETWRIPNAWVSTALTYREVLRTIYAMWRVHNRYVGRTEGRLFGGAVTLDTTLGELPAAARQRLADAASDFGVDTSAATGATTLRQALKAFADQVADQTFQVGTVEV